MTVARTEWLGEWAPGLISRSVPLAVSACAEPNMYVRRDGAALTMSPRRATLRKLATLWRAAALCGGPSYGMIRRLYRPFVKKVQFLNKSVPWAGVACKPHAIGRNFCNDQR
jgi:hypothetical protein